MVRLCLRLLRFRVNQSRNVNSRIHQVHARTIWALHVNACREARLSRGLTHVLSTAGSSSCLAILTGSSSLEKRSFVGPWYALWDPTLIVLADGALDFLFRRSLHSVVRVERDVRPGTVHR